MVQKTFLNNCKMLGFRLSFFKYRRMAIKVLHTYIGPKHFKGHSYLFFVGVHSHFFKIKINGISLWNLFHWADVIVFQLLGSENTVLYFEKLYGRVTTEAYEIPPFLDNRLIYLLFNFFDLFSYFCFVSFRYFSSTHVRIGVQYR